MKIISLMLDVYTIIKHYSRNRSECQKKNRYLYNTYKK